MSASNPRSRSLWRSHSPSRTGAYAAPVRRDRWLLGAVLVGGLLLRVWLAWRQAPTGDLASFLTATQGLQRWGLRFYGHVNAFDPAAPFSYRNYSYPPGYLPWLWISSRAASGGVRFWHLARIPPVAADLALAWLVARELGRRGAGTGVRVLAVAAIALGPSFVVSSAIEGQIDAVAILPAFVAVLVWERGDQERRAVIAGLLIGAGAAIKTAPFLVVLALLPTAVSSREMARVVAWAAAVPVALLLPFVIADPSGTLGTLRYGGFPGAGGVSLVLQPGLARHYLGDYDLSSANTVMQSYGWILTAAGVAVAARAAFRARLAAMEAAALLWLAVYATGVNWYPQYLAWGVPFLVIGGFALPIAAAEIALLPALLIAYRDRLPSAVVPGADVSVPAYVGVMDGLWLASVVGFLVTIHTLRSRPEGSGRGARATGSSRRRMLRVT
jgi:glycosyl transferase family 87